MAGGLTWNDRAFKARLRRASRQVVAELAYWIEAQAKANIVANNQVDTGFMLNSVYAVGPDGDSHYSQAQSAAQIQAEREMGAEIRPDDNDSAVVAVGAGYAIYQEADNSFLYRALEQAQAVAPDLIEQVGREEFR